MTILYFQLAEDEDMIIVAEKSFYDEHELLQDDANDRLYEALVAACPGASFAGVADACFETYDDHDALRTMLLAAGHIEKEMV